MSVDSKQLHNLSRIYREKIAEESVDEGMYDAVKTVMDKGSNFVSVRHYCTIICTMLYLYIYIYIYCMLYCTVLLHFAL